MVREEQSICTVLKYSAGVKFSIPFMLMVSCLILLAECDRAKERLNKMKKGTAYLAADQR